VSPLLLSCCDESRHLTETPTLNFYPLEIVIG